jgi:hypothetical protein
MRQQTLVQAVHLALTGTSRSLARAASALDGCPPGGWPETEQAWCRVRDELPLRRDRSYTIDHFVDAVYSISESERYRVRGIGEAMAEAARIEAESALTEVTWSRAPVERVAGHLCGLRQKSPRAERSWGFGSRRTGR